MVLHSFVVANIDNVISTERRLYYKGGHDYKIIFFNSVDWNYPLFNENTQNIWIVLKYCCTLGYLILLCITKKLKKM